MTAGKKLLIVVGVQFLVLLSVLAFKQYTVWTGETVLLKTTPVDPRDLMRGDFVAVRYEISTIDRAKVADDYKYPTGPVYVELKRGADGYWNAVAVHTERERSYDGTVLIKGHVEDQYMATSTLNIHYGIEQVFVPEGSGGDLPSGSGHTIAVEVKVDRFGNAVPRRFFVDGQPFDLKRR